MSKVKTKGSRPWWWKPLWIGVILSTIVLGFANFFFWHVPIERAVSAMALTLVCVGIAYYIRVRPSMKVNRALYILLGITPIGFILWVIWGVSGIGRLITDMVGAFPSLLISWAVCYGIGAFIGDWIGRKRNYRLPLSP
jgi:MFS family permease